MIQEVKPYDFTIPTKCRRTACNNKHDNCEHTMNRGDFYCFACAKKINMYNPGVIDIPIPKIERDGIWRDDFTGE